MPGPTSCDDICRKGASTCSTKIQIVLGTWKVVATCSWKNPETACATGSIKT